MTITHPFSFGATVFADKCDIPMIVTGFEYRVGQVLVQCSYWLNSKEETVWIPQYRLKESADG